MSPGAWRLLGKLGGGFRVPPLPSQGGPTTTNVILLPDVGVPKLFLHLAVNNPVWKGGRRAQGGIGQPVFLETGRTFWDYSLRFETFSLRARILAGPPPCYKMVRTQRPRQNTVFVTTCDGTGGKKVAIFGQHSDCRQALRLCSLTLAPLTN
ncbi:hypothetical protein LX36DRAFT_224022 [Colletotrichum falcatum]|nr:hypothetical protein LX36DRAFT_224022 [Colletotrichum falcatum]